MEKNETERKLIELAKSVLVQASAKGVTAAEVSASLSTGLSASVRMQEVDTVEFNRDQGLGITVYYDKRKGSASTSDISPQAIAATLDAACEIAKITAHDPCSGLPDPDELAMTYPDCDLHHPWNLSAEQAIEIALDCEKQGLSFDPRIKNSEGASLSTHDSTVVLANSLGFEGKYTATRHSLSCGLVAAEGELMERDYHYTSSRRVDALESPKAIAEKAATRTLKRLGARHVSTQQVPVLFAPEAAVSIIGHFLAAIRGSNLYRNTSFLKDAMGEAIFPTFMTIQEFPHLPGELGSAPFDSDGVKTRNNIYVRDGILEAYLLSTYSARRLNLKTTGNAGGIHNCRLTTSELDQGALLKKMDKGILVTELMGPGVNMTTGDYSRGAFGFWVENGVIQYPVHEFTIAGHLKEMFKRIVAIGSDIDKRGNIHTGSLLLESMTVAGSQ